MKTNHIYFRSLLMLAGLMSVSLVSAQTAWLVPVNWESLVNNQTKDFKDTVLIQGFEENTNYQPYKVTSGEYKYIDFKELKVNNWTLAGSSDSHAICLYPGTTLTFDKIDYGKMDKPQLQVPFAYLSVGKNENINFTVHHGEGAASHEKFEPCIASTDPFSTSFRQNLGGGKISCYFSKLKPNYLSINVVKKYSLETRKRYCCIDSVMLIGYNTQYSLLKTSGDWHNNAIWSHDYTSPGRNALINADVDIHLLAESNHLINNGKNIRIIDKGSLDVKQMTSLYTFPEKGKWYFVSFPFDVYTNGLDKNFTLGDETTQTTETVNNILYVCRYNGKQRAEQNAAQNNWQVISPKEVTGDGVLFHKGEGYLIAIDATSDKQTLAFSSKENSKLTIASAMNISVKASELQVGDETNKGWVLCGNPYPSALSLKDIQPNVDLDGNVYVYDGSKYSAYAIGSDYAIPANSSFFVKAKQDTEIQIKQTTTPTTKLLRCSALSTRGHEPESGVTSNQEVSLNDKGIQYKVIKDYIQINSTQEGIVRMYDLNGRLLSTDKLARGEKKYALPQPDGIYLIHINSGKLKKSIRVQKR